MGLCWGVSLRFVCWFFCIFCEGVGWCMDMDVDMVGSIDIRAFERAFGT